MADAAQLTQNTLELLEKLVSFDSVSRNSNLPIIEFIESYLKEHGVTPVRVPSPDGKKSNLLARVGDDVAGGIMLSGHTDVVPIDGQEWDSDPFQLTKRGEQWFGRGTSDMKTFIAICLAFVPQWTKLKLSRPLWLAFSYDEEVGCLGAPHLLKHVVKHIPKPSFAIIGEPTLMDVVTAHKGVVSFETTVHGLEGHSSQPYHGVNAVHVASELVCYLSNLASELANKGKKDERFDPPYTTVHVGTMSGGTARNIIPKECKFHWEIRPLPSDNADALFARFDKYCDGVRARMRQTFLQADIIHRPMSHMHGVTLPEGSQALAQLVMRCAQKNSESAVAFGTEAGVFNDHGVPAIICGPGSIEQAHKPNEWIAHSQIEAGVNFMLRLTKELS